MIAQLIGFITCSFCFISIGSLAKKAVGWDISCFHDFLVGLALSNAVFTVISLVSPINNAVAFLFVASLIILLIFNVDYERRYFRRLIGQFNRQIRRSLVLFGLLALFIVLTFCQSLYSPSLHYDAGLYHVPAIKWTAEHKTVPGLVHLNLFLGYNFNIFSLDAAFYALFQQPIYPVNFTIICFFALWIVVKISRAGSEKLYFLAAAYLLILFYFVLNFWPHVSTPSTDTLVFVLSSIILISTVESRESNDILYLIVVLAAYSVTVKLSTAPVLLVALYAFSRKYYWSHKKTALLTSLIAGFVLIPWLIKNVMLTGWLLFPFPAIDLFSVDWKLSLQDVIALREGIRNYYMPGKSPDCNGLQRWLLNQSGADVAIIVLSVLAILTLFYYFLKEKAALSREYTVAIGVSVFGVLFMCLNSPSLRYGAAFFLAIILLSIKVINDKSTIGKYGFYLVGVIGVFVFLKNNWFHPWHFSKHIAQRFMLPYPLVLTEKKEFAYFLVDKKIECYYPIGSDQCFEHSLPCASQKVEGLHLIGNEMEQGFYKDAR